MRTWTSTGEALTDHSQAVSEGHLATTRERIEQAIDDLTWVPADVDRTVPAMQGLAVNAVISQLRLPNVQAIAFGTVECVPPPTAHEVPLYGLYGIRCRYANGDANVFVVDRGSDLLVVCSDHPVPVGVPSPIR